jgi:hypothetical protein
VEAAGVGDRVAIAEAEPILVVAGKGVTAGFPQFHTVEVQHVPVLIHQIVVHRRVHPSLCGWVRVRDRPVLADLECLAHIHRYLVRTVAMSIEQQGAVSDVFL